MSVIEILKSLPEINPHDCGVRYEFAGYDGVKQASSVKWCLENYARFCHALRFITEKDGDDGFTVVYWLSHPLFEIKVENGYPLFKIYIGKDGIRKRPPPAPIAQAYPMPLLDYGLHPGRRPQFHRCDYRLLPAHGNRPANLLGRRTRS